MSSTGTEGAGPDRDDTRPADGGSANGDAGPIGPFPTWGWVYGSVIVYTAALVVLLTWLSSALDFGGP